MHSEIRRYLAKIGREGGKIGGASTSEAKVEAARENMKLAHKARRKYPRCPKYNNHSHRFSPVTLKCYGCGFKKPKD